MKKLLAVVAALLFATSFQVQAVIQASDNSGTTVTLTASPCSSEVVISRVPGINAALLASGRPSFTVDSFRSGTVMHLGSNYAMCWVKVGEVVGVIVDDGTPDGVTFAVPVEDFRDVTPI